MKKRQRRQSRTAAIVIGIVVCVALIVVIVLLVRVVIVSGSALLKDGGEAPIETQAPEEVWVSPTMEPLDVWDQGEIVPDYVPDVKENEQFEQTGDDPSIPVDAGVDDLAGTTASPDNLFDPIDPAEDDF